MKSLQKMFYLLWPAILFATMMVSCRDSKSVFGINFTKPDDVKALNELINKVIPPDMVVEEIEFTYSESSSSFSFHKDGAHIIYVDPENNKRLRGIEVNLKTGETGPVQWMEDRPRTYTWVQKGTKLDNFDFSNIADMVNSAVQSMREDSISTAGLGSFSIDFSSGNPEKIMYKFNIQHRTGTQQYGRSVQYQYEEYEFKVDKDGNFK